MIRVMTLDAFEPQDIDFLCRQLFQAFAVGCEFAQRMPLPEEARAAGASPGVYDANTLLVEAEAVKSYSDDKLLYVTRQPLSIPPGPLGRPPVSGLAQYGGERAVVSTSGFTHLADLSDEFKNRLAKEALHQAGQLWDLHTCIDARCAMHPPWTVAFTENEDPILCTFCREKSEAKIKLAKT